MDCPAIIRTLADLDAAIHFTNMAADSGRLYVEAGELRFRQDEFMGGIWGTIAPIEPIWYARINCEQNWNTLVGSRMEALGFA